MVIAVKPFFKAESFYFSEIIIYFAAIIRKNISDLD